MGRKHFNWKIAMVLLLGVAIVAGTVAGLHYKQKTGRYEEYYALGMESFEQGQWKDAAEHLGKYITNDRQNVDVLHKYAQAQLNIRPSKSGNINQAKGAFRDILRIESGDRAAARQLVEMYLQTRAISEAYLVAQRFLKERRDADVECLLAEAMILRREYLDAYELLQSVVEEEPNQISAYERLAAITVERADDFELPAVHWLDLSIRNNPESAPAYLARARFYLMQKERANAIRDLKTALTKTLSDPEGHMTAAVLYRALRQMDSVNEQLDAIQSLEPDYLPMWIFRAGIALASQDKAKMRQVADDSLANLHDNKWDFYALATELYVRAEIFDKAKTCLSILKEQDSRPAEVVYLEGLLALQQDRIQEAVQKWKRAAALRYQGPSPYVQLYLGFKPVPLRLLLASAQMQLGDTISARQLFDSLASDNADNLSVQFALARYMVQSGNWAQARSHAQKILRSDPNNAEATLLALEAEIKLLALEGVSAASNQWQGLEQRLTQLSVSDADAVSISLLKFQMALSRSELDVAESILESMTHTGSVDQQKVTVAWVNLLMAQNRTDEIIERLRTAENQHGQSEQMVRLLAYFLAKAGDYDAAEQVLVDAMSRMNAPSSSLRLGYMLSDLLTQWGKEDEKLALLKKLDQQYPDTIAVQRQLLQCQRIVGSREKAQALVNKIRTFEGEEGWQWRYEQAKLWFGQDDFEDKYSETVSLLQQNLRSNGNDQASRKMLAASHSKAGQFSQALATYQDALNREPYNLSIVIPVVKALQAAKKFDEADDILERVANKELTDPSLDKLQVYSYLQQGQVGSAATLMESYLKDDPNNVGIALVLAKLKIGQKEYDVAKVMLNEIKENTLDDSITFKVEQLEVQVLMQQGLSEQALQRCNNLVTTYKDAESLMLRFNVKMMLGQDGGAEEDLDQAIEYSQDDADLWVKKSRLCWLLKQKAEVRNASEEARHQKQKALDAMDKAILLAPTDPNVVVQATNLFMATQEADRVVAARALLEQASQHDSDDYRYKVQKVRFMLMDADAVSQIQAEALLEQLTIDHPKEAGVWRMLGDLLMKRKDYAKAQNVAIRGLTQLKGNFELLSLKASAEIQISPDFAIQTLQAMLAMLEQSPDQAGVALRLANAHIQAKKPEKAIDVLNAHKALCASEAEIRLYDFTMVSALLNTGQQAEAMALLGQLKRRYSDDPLTVIVQIPHWIREKNYQVLEQAVMDWLEVNPEDVEPVQYFAETVLRSLLGQAKAVAVSERLLSAAVEKQPESEVLLMLAAQTYHLQGRVDEAARRYEDILEVNGRNLVAMNNLAWIYGQDLGEIEKAMQWARKGLEIAPQYTDLLDTYGTLCYRAEEYGEAIKALKECLSRPSYKHANSAAATMYMLAKSYQASRDKTNARSMFRQCLDENRQLENRGVMRGLTPVQQQDAKDQQVALLRN